MKTVINSMNDSLSLDRACHALKKGQIIAYPTEAVFGLGCDAYHHEAVKKIYELKGRASNKGVIIISHDFEMLRPFILLDTLDSKQLHQITSTWPGPHTWVFKATDYAKHLIGKADSVAVRVTNHPVAQALCAQWGRPLVSTSANKANCSPARTRQEVVDYFGSAIFIVEGEVGHLERPTPIQDAYSLHYYRK